MTPLTFVENIAQLTFKDVFNPYVDRCLAYDLPAAPDIRKAMLLNMLQAASKVEVDSIWIGRDLGHMGGRRTGLALTDDVHLNDHAMRWGITAVRPTIGEPFSERTAKVIWEILAKTEARIFLWNVFPFHPHEPNRPFTNRSHSARERSVGEEVLSGLISLLKPRQLVAIGNDAATVARRLTGSDRVCVVRHPSFGGNKKFVDQVSELYGLRQEEPQMDLLVGSDQI